MFRSRWKYLLLSYLFWTPAAQAEIRAIAAEAMALLEGM